MQQQARFRIFATVRGGVTEYFASFVKQDNGKFLEFSDVTVAQKHAARMAAAVNRLGEKATYTYEAVALPPHAA